MRDFFGTPWEDLTLEDVRSFLASAGEEGVTWEAKADGRNPLNGGSIEKAACGLANRIGGFIIVGARWDETADCWALPGIAPVAEPRGWLLRPIERLRPAPSHDASVWTLDSGRVVAVIRVQPVDSPPCMTSKGQVYERVSGATVPVDDPARLEALFAQGVAARERARSAAERAAHRLLDDTGWYSARSVGIALAIAAGRLEPERAVAVFTESFARELDEAVERFANRAHPERGRFMPTRRETRTSQDTLASLVHFEDQHHATGKAAVATPNTSWAIQATLDGAVAVSAEFSEQAFEDFAVEVEDTLREGTRVIMGLLGALGATGSVELVLVVFAAPTRSQHDYVEHRGSVVAPPPPPPRQTLFAHLPQVTTIRRRLVAVAPDDVVLEGILRELTRAAGRRVFEP